ADPAGNDDPGLVQPGAQRDAEVDHEQPQESSRDGFRHVAFLGEQAKGPDSLLNPGLSVSERGRNRTFNLWIKSPLLCQLSYAPQGVVPSSVSIGPGQGTQPRSRGRSAWRPNTASDVTT